MKASRSAVAGLILVFALSLFAGFAQATQTQKSGTR